MAPYKATRHRSNDKPSPEFLIMIKAMAPYLNFSRNSGRLVEGVSHRFEREQMMGQSIVHSISSLFIIPKGASDMGMNLHLYRAELILIRLTVLERNSIKR